MVTASIHNWPVCLWLPFSAKDRTIKFQVLTTLSSMMVIIVSSMWLSTITCWMCSCIHESASSKRSALTNSHRVCDDFSCHSFVTSSISESWYNWMMVPTSICLCVTIKLRMHKYLTAPNFLPVWSSFFGFTAHLPHWLCCYSELWCCVDSQIPTFWRNMLYPTSGLKVKTAGFSKILVSICESTQCHNPEQQHCHPYHCENLKFHVPVSLSKCSEIQHFMTSVFAVPQRNTTTGVPPCTLF